MPDVIDVDVCRARCLHVHRTVARVMWHTDNGNSGHANELMSDMQNR